MYVNEGPLSVILGRADDGVAASCDFCLWQKWFCATIYVRIIYWVGGGGG